MDGDVCTPMGIVVPARALTWRFSRGTGPGGQGVNTTDSRVELVADLALVDAPEHVRAHVRERLGDSLRVVVATERSQLRNREAAIQRLSQRLDAAGVRAAPRTPTRPTRGSVTERLESKHRQAQRKATRRQPGDGEPG